MNIRSLLANFFYRFKDIYLAYIKRFIRIPTIFQEFHQLKDNTTVILFTNNDLLWPAYKPRNTTGNSSGNLHSLRVSLIASVKNEEDNIVFWFERICAQTHKPNEIIIADGGSTDGTLYLLEKQKGLCPIPIQIMSNMGGNIAQGRNMAIQQSSNEIIAVTDFGCLPAIDWLEKIVSPFIIDHEIVVSAGMYDPVYTMSNNKYMKKLWLWGNREKISPQNYLPPGGSAAFQKKVWQEVGGYPEWLTLTGEDTYFDLELKHLGGKWAFVPEAIVQWHAPEKFFPYLAKLYNWAIGDGEMKLMGNYYWRYTISIIWFSIGIISIIIFPFITSFFFQTPKNILFDYYLIFIILGNFIMLIWSQKNDIPLRLILHRIFGGIAQLFGYIRGSKRQAKINFRRYKNTKGLIILLSGVPIDDTGGGARCTQIAMEFLRRNYIVIYLYRFPKSETKELNLSISHPNLIVKSILDINYKSLIKSFQGIHPAGNILVITEHPIREFLPVVAYINKLGGKIIYDLIDAWDTSLGGKWYSQIIEEQIIAQSQILSATAPALRNRLKLISNRKVLLLPNAVNLKIFNSDKSYLIPEDMPRGIWTGIYIGALWGDWFDWKLLRQISETYPNAAFPIIGDYQVMQQSFPKNIYFLGLKKQSELPAYLKHSNVAFIPWKVSDVTLATNPIKVYEYLAMRCPVVAPRLEPLNGIPGVYQTKDPEDFVNSLDKVRKIKLDEDTISSFISENTWEKRVQQLLDLANREK